MKRFAVAALICAFCGAAGAQDLAPETLRLARIKRHIRDELAKLPNYTCLETVARFHAEPPGEKLRPLDRVRLEIVYGGQREWYGSPGDTNLSQDNPAAFVGAGMMADGIFAITLHDLFVADAATFSAQGEESVAGRPAFRYAFRLARSMHGLDIRIPGGTGTVGEEGSFWADGGTLDLLRLEVRAAEIPIFLPLTSAEYSVTYARTRIGVLDAVVPQQADMRVRLNSGVADFNRFDFTHCRAFETTSTLRFDSPAAEAPASGAAKEPAGVTVPATVPALLLVSIRLATTVRDGDSVGQLIEGRVAGAVRRKGKVILEDGARVRGRIRRLDRFSDGKRFVVGLEFTEVQTPAGPMRFYADLLKLEKRKDIESVHTEPVRIQDLTTGTMVVNLPELPGVASFFIKGTSFTLPAGFTTIWRTRGILHGAD